MATTELCPNCGDFTEVLDPITGFCSGCSPTNGSGNGSSEYVKLEQFLAANAAELEFHISQGKSLWTALDLLAASRPTCMVCGKAMKQAKRTSVFCRSTPECRRYSRRYTYLYRERGHTKSQALAAIMKELG